MEEKLFSWLIISLKAQLKNSFREMLVNTLCIPNVLYCWECIFPKGINKWHMNVFHFFSSEFYILKKILCDWLKTDYFNKEFSGDWFFLFNKYNSYHTLWLIWGGLVAKHTINIRSSVLVLCWVVEWEFIWLLK